MRGALLLAALSLLVAAPVPAQDDLLPAAIDALVQSPEDPIFFGIPELASGTVVANLNHTASARCVTPLDDITGDGAADYAVGYAPGSHPSTLEVRNGRTAELVWGATPDGGGFRTLGGLDADGDRLLIGLSSPGGRVECRDTASGSLCWSRDLALGGDGAEPANVLRVRWVSDLDGDTVQDALACGGRGIDALVALSGADGTILWSHAVGDSVYDSVPLEGAGADGAPDLIVGGGDDSPFVSRLAGADGSVLWSLPASGPVTALLVIDGDNDEAIVMGLFAEPATCLVAIAAVDGDTLWETAGLQRNVTSLAALSGIEGGQPGITYGSFDNAVGGVLASNGLLVWRREVSTNNTGAVLSVANGGDVNGNGSEDVYTASQDHRIYVMDGDKGFPLTTHNARSRGVAVAALPDADGDGRAEILVAGHSTQRVLDGASGTAGGPVLSITAPASLSAQTFVNVFAYPTSTLYVMGSLGTGDLQVPGISGSFGLDLATFGLLHVGTAPAAGGQGFIVEPFPLAFLGLTIYYQAATLFEPGNGQLSQVVAQPLLVP